MEIDFRSGINRARVHSATREGIISKQALHLGRCRRISAYRILPVRGGQSIGIRRVKRLRWDIENNGGKFHAVKYSESTAGARPESPPSAKRRLPDPAKAGRRREELKGCRGKA